MPWVFRFSFCWVYLVVNVILSLLMTQTSFLQKKTIKKNGVSSFNLTVLKEKSGELREIKQ